jgi:hypothetical protein
MTYRGLGKMSNIYPNIENYNRDNKKDIYKKYYMRLLR